MENKNEASRPLAVITGAARGIGRAIAERLAAAGYDLALTSRTEQNLQAAADSLRQRHTDITIHSLAADMGRAEGRRAVISAFSALPAPAVLINNAGIFLPGRLHDEAAGTLEAQLQTNLISAYELTRALLPGMMTRRSGHIFNMCSTASLAAYANGSSYGISKFALYGFSQTLRAEMMPYNIAVTAVLPGATFTDSWAGTPLAESRFMTPDDVARMIMACLELSAGACVEQLLMRPMLGDIGEADFS